MDEKNEPVCDRHEGEVRLRLTALHSDAGRPGLFAAYECPECGYERRLPVDTAA